jgi:hypothetical protein
MEVAIHLNTKILVSGLSNSLPIYIVCNYNNEESYRLKQLLHEKIEKWRNQIHPSYNKRSDEDLQLEIDIVEWILEEMQNSKILNDRLA